MKRSFKFALLPLLLFGTYLAVHAEMHHGHHHMDPDKALAKMTTRLNLTSDQAAQVKPILIDREQRREALHANSTLPKDQKRAQRKAIMTEEKAKLDAILTDPQRQQLAQMHHGHHHHGDHDGDKAQTPKAS